MQGVKAFSAPSGSVPLPAPSTVPFSLGQLGAPLIRAIRSGPWPAVGGRAVTYLRQTGRTNRAASVTTPVRGRYASPPGAVVSAPKARRTI